MFIVVIQTADFNFYLRSTVWTGQRTRADEFETVEAAQAALTKVKKFTKPAQFKAAKIVAA